MKITLPPAVRTRLAIVTSVAAPAAAVQPPAFVAAKMVVRPPGIHRAEALPDDSPALPTTSMKATGHRDRAVPGETRTFAAEFRYRNQPELPPSLTLIAEVFRIEPTAPPIG